MKRPLLTFFLLFFTTVVSHAEEYLTGKLILSDKSEKDVLYDRTQFSISGNVFQSVYKVFNTEKKLLYTVTVTHDKTKEVMFFGLKTEGGGVKGFTVRYSSDSSGLIYSDISNTDTLFDSKLPYSYLISFTNAERDYPVLHRIKTDEGNTLTLDAISRIRLKLHKEQLHNVGIRPTLVKQDWTFQSKDALGNELYKARLELFKLNTELAQLISEIRNNIQVEIKKRFTDNRVFADERRYSGDMRKGQSQGNGLLVEKGNVYQGTFNNGQLTKGNAAIKTNVFEYVGQYSEDGYNGVGWLKYANGSYFLGTFSNSVFTTGVNLSKDVDGEIYYGSCKGNQRTGYGELRSNNGDFYFGEFLNGKLVRGYTKEVDQFGYATYSKVENGTKKSADQQVAEEFFNAVLLVKN